MSLFNSNEPILDVRGWYRAATEKRELLAMDDRGLRDIGITRADALRIAKQRPARVLAFRPPEPPHSGPISPELLAAHIARAHRLRDEAIRHAFSALFAAVSAWMRPQPNARLRKLAPVAR